MTPEAFAKKMMNQLELQQQGMRDQYNTRTKTIDETEYTSPIIETNTMIHPKKGETFISYYERICTVIDYAKAKNIKSHISPKNGAWFTHRSPMGCFMCEDMNLIIVLRNVIGLLVSKDQTSTF